MTSGEARPLGGRRALIPPVHQDIVSCFKGLLFVGAFLHQLSMGQMPYGNEFHREAQAAEQGPEF